MKAHTDCIPCALQQALRATRIALSGNSDQAVEQSVLYRVMERLIEEDWSQPPIQISKHVYRIVRELTGVDDPYAEAKAQSNQAALELYPRLKAEVEESKAPLHRAIEMALAGNVMDFGIFESFDVEETLHRVEKVGLAIDDRGALESQLARAESLLLIADNAGEIVFDRLLLETIRQQKPIAISLVVKSGPLINDATMDDIREVGLDKIEGMEILQIGNGDDESYPDYFSPEVSAWIEKHGLVIAKGQANYEGLSEYQGLFYLLMAKCALVASELGVKVGDIIVQYR